MKPASNSKRILLVDDDPDLLEFISHNLIKEGFSVETAANGGEAIEVALTFKPHLILLDLMMPGMDGIETCIELRKMDQFTNTSIAFLTARSEDYSQVAGLEAGADDYICKPIKMRVLISRINALIRRAENVVYKEEHQPVLGLVLDRDRYLVSRNGLDITLPRKEFELLALLLAKPGKVFKRDIILSEVWGPDSMVSDRTIDVHVSKLREKLGERYIKTIKGVGYKFAV